MRDVIQRSGALDVLGDENVILATERILEAEEHAWRKANNWLAEVKKEVHPASESAAM